jgi:hypothetical protein
MQILAGQTAMHGVHVSEGFGNRIIDVVGVVVEILPLT